MPANVESQSLHVSVQFHPQSTHPLPPSLCQVTTILIFPFPPLEKEASQVKLVNPAESLEATLVGLTPAPRLLPSDYLGGLFTVLKSPGPT